MYKDKNYMKKYRIIHKEQIKEKVKEYHKIHKEEIKKQRREYILKNKREINKKHNYYLKNYNYNKRKTNICFKLLVNLRTRIWFALKRNIKSLKTIELIGCSLEFLRKHLESQFKEGMSWSNYGKWHIDHIKPCASFDLSKREQQRKCFHYKNLQPLWAEDNLKKGRK